MHPQLGFSPAPLESKVLAHPFLRGLGDRDYKDENLLTCEPEVTSVSLQPHLDTFSVLASDGLWAYASDQSVVNAVTEEIEAVSGTSITVCPKICQFVSALSSIAPLLPILPQRLNESIAGSCAVLQDVKL